MKYTVALLAAPLIFLSSCKDSSKASSEITDSVRAKLPLYYKIGDVEATTSTQTAGGETADISQLAIEVTLREDLFVTSRLSEKFQTQLNDTRSRFGGGSFGGDKTFLKKVASKGDTKTLYGELVSVTQPDGKQDIQGFSVKDASGKPMSAFNESQVILIGSDQEQKYVDELLAQRAETKRIEEERIAKVEGEKKQKMEAEAARKASIQAAHDKDFADQKEGIKAAFKEGSTYEGVYKFKTGENVSVTFTSFDPQFLHGAFEMSSKEHDFKTVVKFNFTEKSRTTNQGSIRTLKLSGQNEPTGDIDRDITSVSALAYKAKFRHLQPKDYKIADDAFIIYFGNNGSLSMKR